jgi:hypothetical protein
MKIVTKLHLSMALSVLLGLGSIMTARAQDQFFLTWNATGYTYNDKGVMVVTNCNAETLINKVAADNGLDPKDLAFVYRVENLDTVVAFRSNGQFVADVYQMEDTYNVISNAQNTVEARQALLTVEDNTNFDGPLVNIGGIFGIQTAHYDVNGNLTAYSYHGTFNYSPPGQNVVFSGGFATGARLKLTGGAAINGHTDRKSRQLVSRPNYVELPQLQEPDAGPDVPAAEFDVRFLLAT